MNKLLLSVIVTILLLTNYGLAWVDTDPPGAGITKIKTIPSGKANKIASSDTGVEITGYVDDGPGGTPSAAGLRDYKSQYYFDSNRDGIDNDGNSWTDMTGVSGTSAVGNYSGTQTGTLGTWDVATDVAGAKGQYLMRVYACDKSGQGNYTSPVNETYSSNLAKIVNTKPF